MFRVLNCHQDMRKAPGLLFAACFWHAMHLETAHSHSCSTRTYDTTRTCFILPFYLRCPWPHKPHMSEEKYRTTRQYAQTQRRVRNHQVVAYATRHHIGNSTYSSPAPHVHSPCPLVVALPRAETTRKTSYSYILSYEKTHFYDRPDEAPPPSSPTHELNANIYCVSMKPGSMSMMFRCALHVLRIFSIFSLYSAPFSSISNLKYARQ